ncbi:MAG TPA: alcohol dehydrogenase catalytic domain-containing protein [Firmicutes bacterium]|nr:alcohol dehydrogenase catalytic domain-containing protein [Bacillota bacterium]
MGDLPKTMKALVCYAPHDYRLEEVETPAPGPDEVVIKVEACGICAGDVKAYKGTAESFWGGGINPPWIKAPVIPGHEFIGTVVALGPGAREKYGLEIGDRAISEQIVPCWRCRYCKSGHYWMCEVHNIYGFQKEVHGGMAEYMKFTKDAINYKVPKTIPAREAAMIEPLSCSIHAVERADIQLGDVVVISGAGPLGLGMVAVSKLRTPGKLIVLDLKPNRLELAKKLGADIVINPEEDDAVAMVKDLTGGYGCDVYIEATGHTSSVIQGLQMIRKLGTFVEFSVFSEPTTVDWSIIGDRKELNLFGAHLGPYCYPKAIEYIASGAVPVGDIVTHVFPLEQYREAFEKMGSGEDSIKVVIMPSLS